MKVEVAVLGSIPSLIVLMVFCGRKVTVNERVEDFRVQELCKGRGGCPGLPRP